LDESSYQIVVGEDSNIYQVVERDTYPTFFSGDDSHRNRLVEDAVAVYKNLSYGTMSDLQQWLCYGNVVIKTRAAPLANWYCHCEEHTREHICVHVLAVQLVLNVVEVPDKHCSFKTKKRKAGRAPGSNKYGKTDVPPRPNRPTRAFEPAVVVEDTAPDVPPRPNRPTTRAIEPAVVVEDTATDDNTETPLPVTEDEDDDEEVAATTAPASLSPLPTTEEGTTVHHSTHYVRCHTYFVILSTFLLVFHTHYVIFHTDYVIVHTRLIILRTHLFRPTSFPEA
jgi:hypothetical protein